MSPVLQGHDLLFSAFCGEMLVQLSNVDRAGAMSYFLASNKMQDPSLPQFFLPMSNKNQTRRPAYCIKIKEAKCSFGNLLAV